MPRIRKTSPTTGLCQWYVLIQFMVVVVVGFAVLIAKTAPWILKAPVGLVLMASLYSQGLLLEAQGNLGKNAEIARCAIVVGLIAVLLGVPPSSLPQPLGGAMEVGLIRYPSSSAFLTWTCLALLRCLFCSEPTV
mmetsp:Transcript_8708/g.13789  ORF Transcript_8708/g.13789 Transcript_8708/m.13789 type:complete len:135 (-) Transcript_8708:674-1078(-)